MSLKPQHLAAGIQAAYTLLLQGRFEDCLHLTNGLLVVDLENPYLHSLAGSAHHRMDNLDAALASYSQALRLHPDFIDALTARGEILLQRGNALEAAADLNRAVALDPEKKNPAANRAALLIQLTSVALRMAEEKGSDSAVRAAERARKKLSAQAE